MALRRDCCCKREDVLFFMNNIGYIFIVRRLGKQSNHILSQSDSISSLKIHGPCGPNAHAGADLQAFFNLLTKPILLSAHKLTLLIYGDNTCNPLVLAMIIPKPLYRFIFPLMIIKPHCNHHGRRNVSATGLFVKHETVDPFSNLRFLIPSQIDFFHHSPSSSRSQ